MGLILREIDGSKQKSGKYLMSTTIRQGWLKKGGHYNRSVVMDFDKALGKLNDMPPNELEALLREAMIESGIEVQDGLCRFVWEELKPEDCKIDVDKIWLLWYNVFTLKKGDKPMQYDIDEYIFGDDYKSTAQSNKRKEN